MDELLHFAGELIVGDGFVASPELTLCDLPVETIVLTDKPATCTTCSDMHHAVGWTFPLPLTVTA